MPLTATAAKQAKPKLKQYKLSDERGMHLLVKPNGAKYWRLKYRFGGKEKTLALGVYPEVSLAEARESRDNARKTLREDIDPAVARKLKRLHQLEDGTNSFELLAREWFETHMSDKSKSHRDRTIRALERDLFPTLGNRPISQISPPELLAVLRKIQTRGAIETAHRAKQVCGQIFRFAISTGRAERDPSSDLKGALKPTQTKHHPAITNPKEVGKLMIAIDEYSGTATVKAALRLSSLLFCRPGEIRHMQWNEINWQESRWEIPTEKMKMRQPHIVPLCTQALTILAELELETRGSIFVFPSPRGLSRPLSENGVRTALRTLGYDNDSMTPHGFRAMARTLLDEELGYNVDWIEHQLAHSVRDPNGRAYNRTKHLLQRREMMQGWADYLERLKEDALRLTLDPRERETCSEEHQPSAPISQIEAANFRQGLH